MTRDQYGGRKSCDVCARATPSRQSEPTFTRATTHQAAAQSRACSDRHRSLNAARMRALRAATDRKHSFTASHEELDLTPVRANSSVNSRRVQNSPSANRPSFAAANQVATLTRVTSGRLATRRVTGSTCGRSADWFEVVDLATSEALKSGHAQPPASAT